MFGLINNVQFLQGNCCILMHMSIIYVTYLLGRLLNTWFAQKFPVAVIFEICILRVSSSDPKCSMYWIFTYIYPTFKPNLGRYSSPMEPIWVRLGLGPIFFWRHFAQREFSTFRSAPQGFVLGAKDIDHRWEYPGTGGRSHVLRRRKNGCFILRLAPTSYTWSYGAPINGLIHG